MRNKRTVPPKLGSHRTDSSITLCIMGNSNCDKIFCQLTASQGHIYSFIYTVKKYYFKTVLHVFAGTKYTKMSLFLNVLLCKRDSDTSVYFWLQFQGKQLYINLSCLVVYQCINLLRLPEHVESLTLTIQSMAFYSDGHLIQVHLKLGLWENTQHKHTTIQPPTIPRPVSRSQANSSSDLTVLIFAKSEGIYTNLVMEQHICVCCVLMVPRNLLAQERVHQPLR